MADIEGVISDIFDKYAKTYPDLSYKGKALKQADFTSLFSSKHFREQTKYLSNIVSFMPLDVMHVLYIVSDQNQKGYLDERDFRQISMELLGANDQNLERIIFDICFKYSKEHSKKEDKNLRSNSKFLNSNIIEKDELIKIVKTFNSYDYPYMSKLIAETNNDIDFQTFTTILHKIPQMRFNDLFSKCESKGVITPADFKKISNELFYNHLPASVSDQIEYFAKFKFGNELSYNQCSDMFKLIRDLPSLNHLIYQNINGKECTGTITANSMMNYIEQKHLSNKYSKDEIMLFLNWNWLTLQTMRENPHLTTDDLLAIFTDDMVVADNKNISNTKIISFPLFNSIYSFILGSIAGAIGAATVYPIDMIKTRMQNQRGKLIYSGYIDCLKKLIRNEGFRGLYSGMLPQMVGVAPEKAIKLTMNDLVRGIGKKKSKDGQIGLGWEVLAGSVAGTCQVVVTSPLEITKIRLQTQGEMIKEALNEGRIVARKTALIIVNELGFRGIYKGAGACMLRDIPFSSIYFPSYANIKKYIFGLDPIKAKNGEFGWKNQLEAYELLISGAMAGMPAAYFTTPCDVIKTRLQAEARPGDIPYTGIRNAFIRILKEEGPSAFFRGGLARICRSSPQFGFTLAAYEFFQTTVPLSTFWKPEGKSTMHTDFTMKDEYKLKEDFDKMVWSEEKTNQMKQNAASFVNASLETNPSITSITQYYKRNSDK